MRLVVPRIDEGELTGGAAQAACQGAEKKEYPRDERAADGFPAATLSPWQTVFFGDEVNPLTGRPRGLDKPIR